MIYGSLNVDGNFADWGVGDRLERPLNTTADYELYGRLVADASLGAAYVVGLQSTSGANLAVGANTTIWLNTDQNKTTGTSPFGSVGAEFYINWFTDGNPYLYRADGSLVSAAPLDYALSADGKGLEIAISRALLTPSGGAAPTSIDFFVSSGTS